jgi:hypothetical protein
MGERDDRIDTLKRTQGMAERQLGGVEKKYQSERNAPIGEANRDEQIAALTSERNNLQERLARVQGELSELERGRDAEQKRRSADIQPPSPQPGNPDPTPQSATGQNLPPEPQQRAPVDRTDSADAPATQNLSDPQRMQSPRNEASPGDSSAGTPTGPSEPDKPKKGFGPFEPGGPPGGFDPADVSSSVAPFERPRPGEGFPGEWQEKSPSSAFKPFSEVLHNKQAAELDALNRELQDKDIRSSEEQAKQTLAGDNPDLKKQFNENELAFDAEKMNRMFGEQQRERREWGANEHVVDREMELKRWDVTRDLCREYGDRELRPVYEAKLAEERTRRTQDDSAMLALNEKRLAGQPGADDRQAAYDKMLRERRDSDIQSFKKENDRQFTAAVEQRAEVLQAQYFPEVHRNGPEQYFPPIPPRTIDEPGDSYGMPPRDRGPNDQPPVVAVGSVAEVAPPLPAVAQSQTLSAPPGPSTGPPLPGM